jgi:hypothetical protein
MPVRKVRGKGGDKKRKAELTINPNNLKGGFKDEKLEVVGVISLCFGDWVFILHFARIWPDKTKLFNLLPSPT